MSGMDDRVDTCSAAMVSDDILDFSFPQYVESTRTSSSSPQNGKYKIIENYKLDVKFHFFFMLLWIVNAIFSCILDVGYEI